MNIDKFLVCIFEVEGGKSNHKNDKGGMTNYGITQSSWNWYCKVHNIPHSSVYDISIDDAEMFYRFLYNNYKYIAMLPEPLRWYFFDIVVNSGYGGASRVLQRAINRAGGNVVVDGYMGPNTLKELGNYPIDFMDARKRFYRAICKSDPSQYVYLDGWLNRLEHLEKFLKNQ